MTAAKSKRPQLSFEELQQLKWLLGGALTLLGVWTVFYMDVDAWTLMALVSIATLAVLIRPTLPSRVPRLVHTLAFPAIVAFFVGDIWLTKETLPAMVRLDMLLLLYRNLSYRQRRDDLQIIVLGLFLIVIAGVLTVSLAFAAQLLIYATCALGFLLVITLSDAAKSSVVSGGAGTTPVDPVPRWAVHADWPQLFRRLRAVTDWRVVGLGFLLFAGVVGVSALLFLAIPRFQLENSMFLDRFISKKARSGFSESIRFGDVTEIQQDSAVALSVDISDPKEVPATPYWRMLVLDEYRDGVFKFSPALRAESLDIERTTANVRGAIPPGRGNSVDWTFYLESGVSRFLPLLGEFETMVFREAQNFRRAPGLNVIELRNEPVTMTAYRVHAFNTSGALPDPRFAQRWADRGRASFRRTLQLGIPLDTPDREVLERLTREVTGNTRPSAPEFVSQVCTWLRANHTYTLAPKIPNGPGDPLVRWVASREAGHCELFAGSVVLLARAAGFPARVITGFKGGTWNDFSGNYTIRNSDAHAWAEIFDAGSGAWLRADALGPAVTAREDAKGDAALAARTDRSWSARLDSLRVFWYRRIVNFDQRSQAETIKAVKQATENTGRRLRDAVRQMLEGAKAWLASPWDAGRFIRLSYTVILAGGLAWWWRSQGRAWWSGLMAARRGGRREDPVRREAGRWLARFADCETQTPQSEQVTAELQRLRFGAAQTWLAPEDVFRRARRAWRAARRQSREPTKV